MDGFAIRCLVKSYLDSKGIIQWNNFRENVPGLDWLRAFIKRHCLTKRFADNVKVSRAEANHEIMNNYFESLQKWLKRIAPDNIFNYDDETNVTDDPVSKMVIVRGGKNRVARKTHHSKPSTSVMFCGNANGNFLPHATVQIKKCIKILDKRWTKWNSLCCDQKWMVQ